MYIEMEETTNSLKGVASVLSTMSEVPNGSMIWNLYKELAEDIEKLEQIANIEESEENGEDE